MIQGYFPMKYCSRPSNKGLADLTRYGSVSHFVRLDVRCKTYKWTYVDTQCLVRLIHLLSHSSYGLLVPRDEKQSL